MNRKQLALRVLVCASCLVVAAGVSNVFSADISHSVRSGGSASASLELGIGLGYENTPIIGFSSEDSDDPAGGGGFLSIAVNGELEWRGLFAELFNESFTGGGIGYHILSTESAEIDFLVTSQFNDYDPGSLGFDSLRLRKADAVAGVRSTFYSGRNIFQLELFGDISGRHDGFYVIAQAGRFWQKRNWNFHSTVGARFMSEEVVDHFVGIRPNEATAEFPEYKAANGVVGTAEIGATLPLNEKWIWRSTVSYHYLPDAVVDSPLARGRDSYSWTSTINYVF